MLDQRAATATTAATATLGLAAACWVFAVSQMTGMDMGVATEPGSFGRFLAVWVAMMAAMMLPGATPAVLRSNPRTTPLFIAAYLAVWTLVGLVVYSTYQPHGTTAAGVTVIATGLYELTPIKRRFRERCRERVASGLEFGVCCVGSSIGLMALLPALGLMSVTWMCVVSVVVFAQKVLPPKAVVDVPLALAILAAGVLIITTPASVPGLIPSM